VATEGRGGVSISTRTRFEVFKRDEFTCQYCGRQVPDVVLEVDHIVPRVEGGDDAFENLLTSCTDCNRGKAGVPLETRRFTPDLAEQAALLKEKEQQIRAYNEAQLEKRERLEAAFTECWNYWFEIRGVTKLEPYRVPKKSILRHYLEHFSPAEVKNAMDIAYAKLGDRAAAGPYFGGIMRKKMAERRGEQQS
jgi:hypothetical protein